MNQKVFHTLEYSKIIDRLTGLAGSLLGKEKAKNLLPLADLEEIQSNQAETTDAVTRILSKGNISFSGAKDICASIMRLNVGSTLSMEELLSISSLLDTTAKIKNYSRPEKDEEKEDSLTEYFEALEPLTPLNNEIKRCIISNEELSDDASPKLKEIRRSIKNTNNKIHEQLSSSMNSASVRTMLQDNLITMRNGRYCLPVKAEYRSTFSGMIHDQSSTGSTLFIEPMSIVKLNNDLRELAVKEQEEIDRILAELSNLAAADYTILSENSFTLAHLDFVFAKAALSIHMKASEPEFNMDGYIHIKKGRHPLIDPGKVVPIDIRLGKDFDLLIITGPNTGGKTVSLKTAGLFTLMGQAGLHIPAFDHSKLAVFSEVFADIGDEQSIEQSLSTFSSHMKNTISIVEQADEQSLVLFDELGAGTDPTEGAALAMAILSYFHDKGIRTMATTHYSELKIFALSTEGVENGSCEFDVATLRPTYRLLIGIPGKSNAFAISNKLGLPDFIIDDAKKRIDAADQSFEDVISNLEKNRIALEQEQAEIRRYKEEIQSLKEKLEQKSERLDSSKEKILNHANEEASRILQEAKDYADETIKRYNKWKNESGLSREMEEERRKLGDKLKGHNSKLGIKNTKKQSKQYTAKDFKLGDAVKVLSLSLNGTVSSLPNAKGDLYVQMGILRSLVNIKDLELIDEEVIKTPVLSKTGTGKIKMQKSSSVSTSINLIGKTVDEAIYELDKYLDDAYLAHLPQVTIIHGRGTGALKSAVGTFLKKSKIIDSYRPGEFNEGGIGVTVAEFKK